MRPWIKQTISVVAILTVVAMFEWWGFWGIIIFLVSFVAYRLYVKRVDLLIGIRDIEARVWGKPLDKDLWDKKEMKNTKVKVGWRKK